MSRVKYYFFVWITTKQNCFWYKLLLENATHAEKLCNIEIRNKYSKIDSCKICLVILLYTKWKNHRNCKVVRSSNSCLDRVTSNDKLHAENITSLNAYILWRSWHVNVICTIYIIRIAMVGLLNINKLRSFYLTQIIEFPEI